MKVSDVLAALDAQILQLKRIIQESENVIEVLETLKEEKELLVPLGGGVLVKADYKNAVLLDVGGGIVVERSVDDVIERLRRRVEKAREEIERLKEEKNKVLEKVRGQK